MNYEMIKLSLERYDVEYLLKEKERWKEIYKPGRPHYDSAMEHVRAAEEIIAERTKPREPDICDIIEQESK